MYLADYYVRVVVKQQNTDFVQPCKIYRGRRMVKDLLTKPALVRLLTRKTDYATAAVFLTSVAHGLDMSHAALTVILFRRRFVCLCRGRSAALQFRFHK